MALIAIVGFWPRYFGPLVFGTPVQPLLIHIHATVFTVSVWTFSWKRSASSDWSIGRMSVMLATGSAASPECRSVATSASRDRPRAEETDVEGILADRPLECLPATTGKPYSNLMGAQVSAETAKKLNDLAASSGRVKPIDGEELRLHEKSERRSR